MNRARPLASESESESESVVVVLAALDRLARSVRRDRLEAWLGALGAEDRLLLVEGYPEGGVSDGGGVADDDDEFPEDPRLGRLRVSSRRGGRGSEPLVPHLWGIGLRASRDFAPGAEWVGFSTLAMTPTPGWRSGMLAAAAGGTDGTGGETGRSIPEPRLAAIGGAVLLAKGAGSSGRALHAHRHASHGNPAPGSPPAGENSWYRRSALDGIEECGGAFWEVEWLAALRDRGWTTAIAPAAAVRHHAGASEFRPGRRVRHARRYGAWRAARLGWSWPARAARVLAAPLAAARVFVRGALALERPTPGALAGLAGLAAAWATGEALGTVDTFRLRRGRVGNDPRGGVPDVENGLDGFEVVDISIPAEEVRVR